MAATPPTYTYTGDPAGNLLDEARLLLADIGDPDPADTGPDPTFARLNCTVDDATLQYHLSKANVYRACAHVLDTFVASIQRGEYKYVPLIEQRTGSLVEKYGGRGSDVFAVIDRVKESLLQQELEQAGLESYGGPLDNNLADSLADQATNQGYNIYPDITRSGTNDDDCY